MVESTGVDFSMLRISSKGRSFSESFSCLSHALPLKLIVVMSYFCFFFLLLKVTSLGSV